MYKAKQAYLQTQVTTTTQGELVVMLYDGAIKFLQQAKEKMAEKSYAEKGILISKALDIIAELDASLNIEKGGDLSSNLHSLYVYAQGRLLQANLKVSPDIVDEVINMLSSLRGAFAEIINSPEAIAAQKQAPEQLPVKVNNFRKSTPFGINMSPEQEHSSAPATTSSTTRVRAYQQQASTANPEAHIAPMPEVAAPHPVSSETPSDQALTGFARQMINNSMYKKMAMNTSG